MNKVLVSLTSHNGRRYLTTSFFSYDVTGRSVSVNPKMKQVTINGKLLKIDIQGRLVK